ncbi:M56 family metallopeptidase [uncultured Winogradskyella sp.]|uniref:M56 family metallopeptidase n=1 Tax=uncultured Winogradskyella sp. TaxID=395353 RepID=UPI002633CD27|nr:M56 family metallopeptidase [uncultured Winogradskyella sp.]
MEYLLKASAVIFIFYTFYKLFLQRETFFQTNRLYLIIGLLTALLIPLIVIPIYIEYTPAIADNNVPIFVGAEVHQNVAEPTYDISQIIYAVYGIGLAFFLGKLLIELTSLKFLFNKHQYYKSGSYVLIETNNDIPPFSFFHWIVYNPKKYSKEELNHILNHEKAHAKELHSIDIVLTQLACVLFWFNPFVWFYKKEVQQNLEFIADKKAQDFSKCEKSYQLILLKSSVPNHKFLITNNFYNSQIKKRIIMLHKSKSKKLNAWKYLLILPVLALFLMSFNTKEIFVEIDEPADLSEVAPIEASAHLNNFYDTIEFDNKTEAKSKNHSATTSNNSHKNNSKLIAQTSPKAQKNSSNKLGDISVIVISKNTSDADLDKIIDELKREGLTVKFKGVKRNSKGEITAIKIDAKSKKSNASYNVNSDEAIDPVKIVFDKDNNSISIGNENAKHGVHTYVYEAHTGGKHKISKSGSGNNVYVITEDYEYEDNKDHNTKVIVKSNGKKGKVKTIKRSKNIEVISGDDDMVEIIVEGEGDEEETIIVNGKKIHIAEGKENVVVKGRVKQAIAKSMNNDDVFIIELDDTKNKIFISDEDGKNPLFIIDDKEVSKDEISDLDPDDIESVTVLKDKSAIEKYGDKAKDGVVIIKTKKN